MQRKLLLAVTVAIGTLLVPVAHLLATDGEKPVVLVLLGPPGSGRDVLAVKVSSTFSLPYVSCADLLLDHCDEDGESGKKTRDCLHAGEIIPDSLMIELIKKRVANPDCKQGFLLDGFPKTAEQAKVLEKQFQATFSLLPAYISTSDEWLINFHEGRLVCTTCGRVYHTDRSPPKHEEQCDFCESALIQRDDDTPETLKKRTENYRTTILPVLTFYSQKEMLVEIDGDRPLDEMMQDIKILLNKKQKPQVSENH